MKKYTVVLSAIIYVILLTQVTMAQHVHHGHRADEHAPVGVMAGHTHKKGEWMTSYKYMWMEMNEILESRTVLNTTDVHKNYMVSPLNMKMSMQMAGLMYAPTDRITVMSMVPIIQKSMDHKHKNGTIFTRNTEGVGDIKLLSLIKIFNDPSKKAHAIFGLSLPSGSIDEKDGQDARLPYSMQLGSGTYDLIMGATMTHFYDTWSIGIQPMLTTHLNTNNHNYSLGDHLQLSSWIAKVFLKHYSSSLRVTWKSWQGIYGKDSELMPSMVPTATTNKGGKSLEIGLGVNAHLTMKNRLVTEFTVPVIQSLDGIQMATNSTFIAGWQYLF